MTRNAARAIALAWSITSPALASAQPEPEAPLPDDAEQEEVTDPVAKAILSGDKPDPLADALASVPGGLKPEQVAARASTSSRQVAVRRAELRAAAARLDQAIAAYFPRVTAGASYTRMSEVENQIDVGIPGVVVPTFPVIVNSYQLTASLEVPLSDYVLKLTQGYAAASLDAEAKDLAVRAERLQIEAEAKIAYYTWIRAHGRAAVAALATVQSERHLVDAKATFEAGLISQADVLRLEAQVAQARHLGNAARAFIAVSEEQLRTIMHLKPGAKLLVGVDVLVEPPPPDTRGVEAHQKMALESRLDRKSLAKSKEALEEATSVARANYYPRIAGFAEAMYANPNPRIFPQENKWDFTWQAGVRLTWTINDTFATIGAAREVEAQGESVKAQLGALEDGIRVSVAQAYHDVATARSAIEAAATRERAADAALEARRRLFLGGRATATDMVDAEAELTEARLQRVDAHVDWLIAWARLELAVGKRLR
jgi:outer membrane protein TolC